MFAGCEHVFSETSQDEFYHVATLSKNEKLIMKGLASSDSF